MDFPLIQSMDEELTNLQRQNQTLEDSLKEIIDRKAKVQGKRKELEGEIEELLDEVYGKLERKNQFLKENEEKIEKNVQYFRSWKNYKPLLSVYPVDITINVQNKVKVKNYQKQVEFLRQENKSVEKRMEDEIYKMKLRVTLSEIELKEAQNRRKRK